MKKVILNISTGTYEKLRFEAIRDEKSIEEIIKERIFHKPFSYEVEVAFLDLMEIQLEKLLKE